MHTENTETEHTLKDLTSVSLLFLLAIPDEIGQKPKSVNQSHWSTKRQHDPLLF